MRPGSTRGMIKNRLAKRPKAALSGQTGVVNPPFDRRLPGGSDVWRQTFQGASSARSGNTRSSMPYMAGAHGVLVSASKWRKGPTNPIVAGAGAVMRGRIGTAGGGRHRLFRLGAVGSEPAVAVPEQRWSNILKHLARSSQIGMNSVDPGMFDAHKLCPQSGGTRRGTSSRRCCKVKRWRL